MLVCWRNWTGDTRRILRNDFSIADACQEPARLIVTLAGSFSFPKVPLGAGCLPHRHTCHHKHERKKRSGLTQEA